MKKLKVVFSVLLVLLLSGCSALSFDGSDIMCPPKATGSKAQIQKIIDKQSSGSYTLKYPKSGYNRSSIVMHDVDNDEDEEAVAFYTDKEGEHIHVLFVEGKNDDYSVIDDVILEANSIDRIDFADIDGDKIYEILIGYSTATSSQNTLNVYKYSEEISLLNTSCTYSSLVTGDFNNDKNDDILLISLYSGDIASLAKLMIHNGKGELTEISSVELDSDITSLALTQYGQISYGVYGAIIDGISSTGDYATQVVFFDSSQPSLINPLYSFSGYSKTRRSTQICSVDFDKDELIDVPVCSLMSYNQTEDLKTISRRVDWSNFDCSTYTLVTAESSILCPQDGYLLDIPEKWGDAVTARYDDKKRETTVYAYEYKGNALKLKEKVITIKAFFDEDFEKESYGYIEFLRSGSTVYGYSIGTADNYLSVTGEEISSLFSLVNQ